MPYWTTVFALLVLAVFLTEPLCFAENGIREGEMSGYLIVPLERAPEHYDAGFSMYVAAWPLLKQYPGNRFQTGLFGTWMHAQSDHPESEGRLYSDIEGGLGWWRDTRFATETPKFIRMVREPARAEVGVSRPGNMVWRNSAPGCCGPRMV
jgi:hypothetical protein